MEALVAFHRYDSTLIVMATGCGKSATALNVARHRSGRVCIMVHRDELVRQWVDEVKTWLNEDAGVEKAEETCDKQRVVVTSVQTMTRPNRKSKFDPYEFGLLVVDESHHGPAKSYVSVIDHFALNPECKRLFLTATPRRSDNVALGSICESVAYDYSIVPAIKDGWLVPVVNKVVTVEHMDVSDVTADRDFRQHELDEALAKERVLHGIAVPTLRETGDSPCLVFCAGLHQARALAEVMNNYKPRSAIYLCGDTDDEIRRTAVAKFKAGEVQYLVNYGLFLEGFNAVATRYIAMARPTKSLLLYCQIMGRGTRPLAGVVDGIVYPDERREAIRLSAKPNMVMLDFAGNTGKHRIVTCQDALGGAYGAEVRAYARKNIEAEPGAAVRVDDSLERALAELNLEDEERERKARIRAIVKYRSRDVSPFDGEHVAVADVVNHDEPATPAQIGLLSHLGVGIAKARSFTKRQAGAWISWLKRKHGM